MSAAMFDSLLASLAGVPALPGARCRGRHHLFDARLAGEDVDVANARHSQALELCAGCPALSRCEEWVDSLPPSRQPAGIVAGRLCRPPVPRLRSRAQGESAGASA